MPAPTIEHLRGHAIERSLFSPTSLGRAISKLGFVQADPIRAPARAQDLTLRHRVKGYRMGDLERRYAKLEIEEGFFVNYGFLPRSIYARLQPSLRAGEFGAASRRRSREILAFVREQGAVHPREAEAQFGHGNVRNYWGGLSNATTRLLEDMHFRGLLRVVRRDAGVRVYAAEKAWARGSSPNEDLDALVDVIVGKYAPLPGPSLSALINRLRWGTPQWAPELGRTLARAKQRLAHARVAGVEWYWPEGERPVSSRRAAAPEVRLLAPFDPVVWDRRRFQLFWGWAYRFEAYTPLAKRKLGYYALPLLWRDQVIGWANLSKKDSELECALGFVEKRPRDRLFERELEAEIERMREFLG